MDGGRQAITLLVTFVLAGILGPAAFGVAVIATTYVAFLQLLTTQGLQPALIQRQDLRPAHPDAAFWMILTASGVLALVTVPVSAWWADVNHTPELRGVVIALTLLLPIQSVKLVQEALLRRELNFRPLAVRTNVSVLVGGMVGIVAAFVLRDVWALVAQQAATVVLDVAILWRMSPWRPGLRFERRAARDLVSYTAGSSLASLGVFASARADVLVTGLFFGAVGAGIYRFASRLVDTAINVTVTSLHGASLPELARFQDDPRKFADRLVVVMRASALLSLPALGVLAGVAEPLMEVVGDRWEAAAAPLMVLCIMAGARALMMFIGPMLQALGRVGQLATLSWLSAALSVVAFVVAGLLLRDASLRHQVLAMSWSRAVLYGVVFMAINIVVLRRNTQVRVSSLAVSVLPSLAAGQAGLLAAGLTARAVRDLVPDTVRLAAAGGAGAAVAAVVLWAADPMVRTTVARHLAARGWGGYATAAHAPTSASATWEPAQTAGIAVATAALRASDPSPRAVGATVPDRSAPASDPWDPGGPATSIPSLATTGPPSKDAR
jgi:teichuronic acid exporter